MATSKKTPVTENKRSAKNVIKRQPKREVSYQIADIKRAITLCKNVDSPDRNLLLLIYDYIMRDSHLLSQIRNAKFEVLSEPWQIYNGNDVDQVATDNLQKRWFNIILEYIFESELYGFTLVENDLIDPSNFSIGEVLNFPREYVSIEKQWILIEGTINGSYLPYGAVMNELDLLEFGKRDDLGILLVCAYNVIWKYYSRSDWGRASEKFGMPILNIEADTNNDTELDNLERKAANFGSDGYVVTQKGDKATIIERTGQRLHDIYLDNMKFCNDEISKAMNGQTNGDPKSFVGSAEVGERTMNTFTLARLQNMADEVNQKFIPYLIAKGFKLSETNRFDYPALIRERQRKLTGPVDKTDPTVPGKKNKDIKPEEK